MKALLFVALFGFLGSEALQAMPTPKGLEGDVKFWEKIFHTYRSNHCVIHDKKNLDSIFIVKPLPTGSSRKRRRLTKVYMQEVKQALRRLGRGRAPSNSLERRVVRGTPSKLRYARYYRAASKRLRCQRGVEISHSLKRSTKYLRMIKKVLRRYSLPQDLAYLPHLESGYNRKAHSKAGARGIWQLLKSNAKSLGLRVSRWNDQRTNPYKSTVAAAKLLKKLKKKHKKWPLAITAYNYGTNGMRRAIKKYGYDYMKIRRKHRTRIFGFAVKNYYPSFLAVKNVASKSKRRKRYASRKTSKGQYSF